MEKPQMISIAGLKARGWTQALITLLWGTGCGRAQFSLCEISAYAPLRHRKSSFLRGVVRVSCCKSESCSASLRSKDCGGDKARGTDAAGSGNARFC